MDDSHQCKNYDSLLEKIKELESKLQYYENLHSSPSSDSLYWRKQKKERKSENHPKIGAKPGHKGTTHSLKPTSTIHHDVEKCSSCGGTNITQTTQHTRIIAEIPKPQPITVTKHVMSSYTPDHKSFQFIVLAKY